MKKIPDYKTAKWDKRKDVILKEIHYDYEEGLFEWESQ